MSFLSLKNVIVCITYYMQKKEQVFFLHSKRIPRLILFFKKKTYITSGDIMSLSVAYSQFCLIWEDYQLTIRLIYIWFFVLIPLYIYILIYGVTKNVWCRIEHFRTKTKTYMNYNRYAERKRCKKSYILFPKVQFRLF